MTLLSTLYASSFPGGAIRTCDGFEDRTVTLETGQTVTFTA